MPADLSAISYFAPILAFLIVFLIVFSVLIKTKILGENKWFVLFISFIIATIFISTAGAVKYIGTIVPWFAVLLVSLAFLLVIIGFVGKPAESFTKGIGVAFIIILALVFIISAFFIFSYLFTPYIPGPGYGSGLDEKTLFALDTLYSSQILGAILLIVISAIVSWVLVKTK
ncbi:hypothetical protein HYV50_01065 [Candidatus Pacearchaeota archaeon]|nr:hypothetical protein [Candidatus Pacearchaeota archaeon]